MLEGAELEESRYRRVNLRCYREQVLTSFRRDVRTSPAGMQDLVKQDLRGVGDDFECAMKGTDNVIWYCGEGKVLQRGINGIRLGRKRRSRMDGRRYFDHVLLGLTLAADKSDWIVKSVLWP